VISHRLRRQRELSRDLRRREAGSDQGEDLALAGRHSRLRLEASGLGRRTHVEGENEDADNRVVVSERQVLCACAPQVPARVDEHRHEVCRLPELYGAAKLRRDIRARFRSQQIGEVGAKQLGV
jgi:hypothetical protein